MTRKKLWKSFAAWLLILGMVFSDGSFAVYAQEMEPQEVAVDEKLEGVEEIQEETEEAKESEAVQGETEEVKEQEVVQEENAASDKRDIEGTDVPDEPTEKVSEFHFEWGFKNGESSVTEEGFLGIFEGQEVTATVTDMYSGAEVESVSWKVYEDTDAMRKDTEIESILNVSGNTLSFTLPDGKDEADYILYAFTENEDGSKASEGFVDLFIKKQKYEYDQPYAFAEPGGNQILKDGEIYIDSEINYRGWTPKFDFYNGEDGVSKIKSITIISGEDLIDYQQNEDGDWYISGKEKGTARIKVTYARAESDPESGDVTFEGEIEVTEDIYRLIRTQPEDMDQMLINSTMTIDDFAVEHVYLRDGSDGGQEEELVKDFTLSASVDEGCEGVISASVSGRTLTIESKDEMNGANVTVTATVGGRECKMRVYVLVSECYYRMLPETMENLKVGESLDLNDAGLQLMCYDSQNKEGRVEPDAVFKVEYIDEDVFESSILESGKLPVIRRISPNGSGIEIAAYTAGKTGEAPGEEVERKEFYFDYLDYNDVDFKFSYGDGRVFEGTPLEIELVPGNTGIPFPEECWFEWSANEQLSPYVQLSDSNVPLVTMTAKTLKDDEISYGGEIIVQAYYGHQGDRSLPLFGEEGISCWVEVVKPSYDYHLSPEIEENNQLVVGDSLTIGSSLQCEYKDVEAPYGAAKWIPITKVEVSEEWDDEDSDAAKGSVVDVTKDAGKGWIVSGKNKGGALLKISYTPLKGGASETIERYVHVGEEIYLLNWEYPEGYDGWIKPDNSDSLTVSGITLTHKYLDRQKRPVEEKVSEFDLQTLEPDSEDEDPYTSYIDVSVDNSKKSVTITGKKEGDTSLPLRCLVNGMEECMVWISVEIFDGEHCKEHKWGEWEEYLPATCTEIGLRKRWCDNCGMEQQETVTAGHKWGTWAVKSTPTVFAAGVEERICSVCKKTESRAYGSKLAPTMTLTANSLKMQVKQKTTAFKVTGMASGDYVASVTSGNTKVLKVSGVNGNGTFKLSAQKKAGSAKLTIRLASGLTKVVKVTVQKKAVKTSKISGLNKKLALKKGASAKLAPVIAPVTSKDKVKYKTSNKKVVTVTSKGVIKAKKAGKAKITVKSGSKKFTVTVTVK